MRHAKSSWDHEGLRDFDRPLNKRGEKDAPRMGKYLKKIDVIPDVIISSTAKRAQQTITGVCGEIDFQANLIRWNEDLYYGSSDEYINAIRTAPDEAETVMTVGHNPMTEDAMAVLSDQPFRHRVPTATIACFEIEATSWKEVKTGTCKLQWIVSPKEI